MVATGIMAVVAGTPTGGKNTYYGGTRIIMVSIVPLMACRATGEKERPHDFQTT